jgi:hypothetical protein
VGVFALLSTTVLFNARSVVVVVRGLGGEFSYTEEQILTAGGIKEGLNLLRFDATQAQTDITSALVQLDSVQVQRVFPSTIVVTVERAEPTFAVYERIAGSPVFWIISQNGRIIDSKTHFAGVVVSGFATEGFYVGGRLTETAENIPNTELAFTLLELFALQGEFPITRIDLTDRFGTKLYYGEFTGDRERIEIRLETATGLGAKIAIAARIISDEIAENERGILRLGTLPTFTPYVV